MAGLGNTTATGSQPMDEKEVVALGDAKRRLLARITQLTALRVRAQRSGNTKMVVQLDADLKEANSLKARLASVEAMLAPFLRAWQWLKDKSGLGELGALFVPIAVVGGISAVIYAINVFDRKMETAADRYDAEIEAVEKWKKQGLTAEAAQQQVNKTGAQVSEEKKDDQKKPGLFDELQGMIKVGGVLLLLGGGWYLYNNGKNAGRKPATN